MLAKRIIPCLDVKNGRVVKGIKFKGLKDAGDPVSQAKFYDSEGADELVFLDITASSEKRKTVIELARNVAKEIFIPFTIGGGIRTVEDIREILRQGADKISINTIALLNPGFIDESARLFGSQCIVVAVDAKRTKRGFTIYSHGGRRDMQRDAIEWVKEAESRGAGEILLTSMDTDGVRTGFDLELTKLVSEAVSIPVIASGGGGEPVHFFDAIVEGRADAVLAASVFHYRYLTIQQIKQYCHKKQVPVRLN
ncbi:imidazole glycerol phosphate synthase subunit HisF [candidate division KSB1 bacterium]|nr:imidazole glycerol phosphate synthase subunit HisF [candidate division KSB1 bacterium]